MANIASKLCIVGYFILSPCQRVEEDQCVDDQLGPALPLTAGYPLTLQDGCGVVQAGLTQHRPPGVSGEHREGEYLDRNINRNNMTECLLDAKL